SGILELLAACPICWSGCWFGFLVLRLVRAVGMTRESPISVGYAELIGAACPRPLKRLVRVTLG
ncbi:MAG: hypothetical protein WA705_20295, partial [Candidatus Ozemobacteraceae bacterium]